MALEQARVCHGGKKIGQELHTTDRRDRGTRRAPWQDQDKVFDSLAAGGFLGSDWLHWLRRGCDFNSISSSFFGTIESLVRFFDDFIHTCLGRRFSNPNAYRN